MKSQLFVNLIAFFLISPLFGQQSTIKKNRVKFEQVPLIYDKKLFNSIFEHKISNERKIIALGEFSHGAYEPIAFKANLVKYLIEVKGYRNILFELSDFSMIKEMREYLNDNNRIDQGFIEAYIKKNHFTRAVSSVYTDLFNWIKCFNLKNPKDLITINGFELDTNEKLIEYILNRYIIPLDYKKSQQYVFKLNSQMDYLDKLNVIKNWYHNDKKILEQVSKKKDIQELDLLIKNAIGSAQYQKKRTENQFNNNEEESLFRDSVMAENIIGLSADNKSIVWAHNGHVIRTGSNHMGTRMNKVFGKKLYVIVTDFSRCAAVDFVDQDSSCSDRFRYSTKIIFSGESSAANNLYKRYNIKEGIFCPKDLIKRKVGQNTNAIGALGSHFMIPGDSKSFDLLAVFENSYPDGGKPTVNY